MAKSRRRRKVVVINRPRKRRRSRARRKAAVVMLNPRRRRSSRRRSYRKSHRKHYRSNPALPSTGFLMDAVYVTGGYFATRFATGFVMPFLGSMADQPMVRIAAKGGVSWGLGFLGGKFLGQRAGQLLMLGGLVETLSDAVKTYVSPFVPALAAMEVGSYPMLSSYPALAGSDYSNPYSVNMGHDEAL